MYPRGTKTEKPDPPGWPTLYGVIMEGKLQVIPAKNGSMAVSLACREFYEERKTELGYDMPLQKMKEFCQTFRLKYKAMLPGDLVVKSLKEGKEGSELEELLTTDWLETS